MKYSVLLTGIVVSVAACSDSVIETNIAAPDAPAVVHSRGSLDPSVCEVVPTGQRIDELQKAVQQLPSPATLYARARMLPALADARGAVNRHNPKAAIASIDVFIQGVAELRLRVPLEDQISLVTAARCARESLSVPST